ncbi:Flavin-dependent oxidoreductase, luciferase family (includes alkanesulfonate monooxygenase SsuD and methylene tetrahydromethanopterin reductase) [Pseudonocardia thermophila]|uniref:Flavin-dependent oxidoreductase, luciferase family (Includes alkanesulfonate monooxygenase SsuD and methylene tetrahydromethanopterin reductase) n=1 Tax=Pseudonocardia thermophila TaxID=1848 RepID=A0A1M6SYM9_PSETH|nr:LLM class flavin-dependent oxidoreductase [Pseudonocardia thermophila]SHK49759.1 Flavin-dependent oxidoreductase, luciferase family (includes alkanesulfonate monooxygenase SsuD and methylene tetrahydromethanopterin reductase) [Pseudonocardia thermophila]
MRFQVLDIVPHSPHPVTGELISVHERLERVVEIAVLAERVGFDSYAVGERHAGEFVSSSPTVLLGALAQATSRILLSTGVTVLSLLDPVRVAEDYATIDQLSGGRLEIVIGKGNEDKHFPMFGLQLEKQYEYFVENYELLRRLLREENVTWQGTHRAPLTDVTTHPRPYAGPFRIWHGSATSTIAVDLAAKWGDPLFTANALQPRENYQVLIDRYREKFVEHGHDPATAYVGAGSGGLFLADTDEEAIAQYRPIYEGFAAKTAAKHAGDTRPGKVTSFATLEEAVARGPALVGTSERVAEKIIDYHASFRHDVQSVSINPVLPYEQQKEVLIRFAEEVIPLVKRELHTTLWGPEDAGRASGFTAADTVPAA